MTFLGAQEIDSDLAIERPLMVSSADFAAFTKAGEVIVNYTIVDLDGDGIGELVVVNSASVAGDDVISDPVPTLQLGDIAVTGQSGTSLRIQQDGISGRPGDLVQIEASGFNPVSSQSNRVVWTANGTVVEATATASGGTPQTLSFIIPVLPAGPATVELSNLSSGVTLEPIAATILAADPLGGTAEEIIDQFLTESITFVQGLPTDEPGSAGPKSDLIAQLTSLKQDFAIVFGDLATSPDAVLEALLEQIAVLFANSPILASSSSGFFSQDVTPLQKSTLEWIQNAAIVGGP